MVQVSIHPVHHSINHHAGGRYFPFSGYLGLTKVQLQGIVRTRIEDDHKLLAASRVTISVKCYEIRTRLTYSRVNTLIDVTQVLWSNPSLTHECADIGDLDLPFRISLPADTGGPSTLNFPDYKIFWRLEAAIEHPYHLGLGSRQSRSYDLDFTRYDIRKAPTPPSNPLAPHPGYRLLNASSRCEPFYYRIEPPETPQGPGDELPVRVSFIFNSKQPSTHIQSLSVALERRLNLCEAAGSPTPSDIMTMTASSTLGTYQLSSGSSSTSLLLTHQNRSTSHLPGSSKKRSDSPPGSVTLSSKSITTTIVSGQTSDFDTSLPAESTCLVNLSLPAKPPPSQWPIGESLKTDLAEIKFELRVKVNAATPMGLVEIPLEPLEVRLTPVSREQRSIANAKIAKKKEKARAKSAPNSRRSSPTAARRSSPTRSTDALASASTLVTSRTRSTPGKARRSSLTLGAPTKNEVDARSLSGRSGAELDNISTSGSSRAGPDTPPPRLPPKESPSPSFVDVSYFDSHSSTPTTASTTASRSLYSSSSASTSALATMSLSVPSKSHSEEEYPSKSGRSSALKRLPLISTHSSSTVRPKTSVTPSRTPVTPSTAHSNSAPRASVDSGFLLGVTTTPTSLKRMPTNVVRDWEQELEKITNKSRQGSDTMPRFRERTISNASTSQVSQLQATGNDPSSFGSRARRSTVNALTALGVAPALTGPPSSFKMFKQYPR